jgi:hypothetical protein
MPARKKTRKSIGKFGGDKHDFVDTADKAKGRIEHRRKLQEILEKEIKQERLEEELRIENRKIGQLSLTETRLSHFTKKKGKQQDWW